MMSRIYQSWILQLFLLFVAGNTSLTSPCTCICMFHSSGEDEDEPLDWLPIAPEIEEPEETGWGQLEVWFSDHVIPSA